MLNLQGSLCFFWGRCTSNQMPNKLHHEGRACASVALNTCWNFTLNLATSWHLAGLRGFEEEIPSSAVTKCQFRLRWDAGKSPRLLAPVSNTRQWKDSHNLKKADIVHLAVTHKGAGGEERVIPSREAPSEKRGFVHAGWVVTESHNLFLDGKHVTLNTELLGEEV